MACPMSCYCGMVVRCGCNCSTKKYSQAHKKPNVSILLLGAAETGKSTIMRQMKIIHDGEMPSTTLRTYRSHVIKNVHNCLKKLLKAVSESGLPWTTSEAEEAATILKNSSAICWGLDGDDLQTGNSLAIVPTEHSQLISAIWNDETSQDCYSRASEFNLPDSTSYYLNEIDRISQSNFVPTQEDVLRLRLPTKAATDYHFTHRDWNFKITDVGGQRGERRRWIRLFHGLDAIIFLAALSEFDQTWREEEEESCINRLELSLQLFGETLSYPGFSEATIIVFLNKTDVLRQKIGTSHLDRYFPNYQGPRNDPERATQYIRERFLTQAESCYSNDSDGCKKSIYTHETCATDTDKTKFVFTVVRDHILWTNLRRFFDPIH